MVVIVGGDLTCEIAARALAAAGVGRLRWVSRTMPADDLRSALRESNPDLHFESVAFPDVPLAAMAAATTDMPTDASVLSLGDRWLERLAGAVAVIRSGFDDDPMLRATVRLGIPAVVVRSRGDELEMVSFRQQPACPHVALDVPTRASLRAHDDGGASAVVSGHLAAAEILVVLTGAAFAYAKEAVAARRGSGLATNTTTDTTTATAAATATKGCARMIRLWFDTKSSDDRAHNLAHGAAHSTDIPWSPACFACGGFGQEMSLS